MDWKGEEDYDATLLRGMVLFAPKTAVVGLRHLTYGVNTSTCQNRSSLRVIIRLIYLFSKIQLVVYYQCCILIGVLLSVAQF